MQTKRLTLIKSRGFKKKEKSNGVWKLGLVSLKRALYLKELNE